MRRFFRGLMTGRGGVLLEFSIVATVLFAVVFSLWMLGIILIHYSILADAASSALRDITVTPARFYGSCAPSMCPQTFVDEATKEFARRLKTAIVADAASKAQVRIQGAVTKDGAGKCRFKVSMAWPVPCIFCGWLNLPKNIMVTAESTFENPEFILCADKCGLFPMLPSKTEKICEEAQQCW